MFRTPPNQRLAAGEAWTRDQQLLALAIEVISVRVAGKQLKKPVDIPRPGKKSKGGRGGQGQRQEAGGALRAPVAPPSQRGSTPSQSAASRDAAFKQGIAVLQRTAKPRR